MAYGAGTTTVTNPLGKDFTYSYSPLLGRDRITRIDRLASASTPAATLSFGYDANAYVNQVTDWNGNVTKYTHNARGLQTSRTEAFGTPEARTTDTVWDPAYRVPGTVYLTLDSPAPSVLSSRMARIARVVVPGVPHHVTQRGNRRLETFFSDADYRAYIALLGEHCRAAGRGASGAIA